jgi:hypothetical protein
VLELLPLELLLLLLLLLSELVLLSSLLELLPAAAACRPLAAGFAPCGCVDLAPPAPCP